MLSRFNFKRGPRVFEVLVEKHWTPEKLSEAKIDTLEAFPIFLEEDDFERGGDVFALDFFLMRNEYELLEGKDIVSKLKINKKDVAHALETEVRRLLSSARSAYYRKIPLNTEDLTVTLEGIIFALNYLEIKKLQEEDLHSLLGTFFTRTKLKNLLNILEIIERAVDKYVG